MKNKNPISRSGAPYVAHVAHVARVAASVALAAMAWVSMASVRTPAAALAPAKATPAQAGANACKADGKLIVPAVDANHTYGWSFVANFDHTASPAIVTTCLAERWYSTQPFDTKYTVMQHCQVENNVGVPQALFGNGLARFDGNAYLSCMLPVPETWPDLFWVRVRTSLPSASQGYTFLSSAANISFTGQTDAVCGLTLNSVYKSFTFSHMASTVCGTSMVFGSRVMRNGQNMQTGAHRIDAVFYGPVTGGGTLILPANFTFNIGAIGQVYALDWLVIDPTPSRCCSPN